MSRESKFHLWHLIAYIVLIPISFLAGWMESVTYVSALSIWALVLSQAAVLQASRAKDAAGE